MPSRWLFNHAVKARVFTPFTSHSVAAATISFRSTCAHLLTRKDSPDSSLLSTNPAAPERMRKKRLVTFQMVPNRAADKGKGEATEATELMMADGWRKSKCSESSIASLVDQCLL